jgi:hypothetical protein
MKKFILCVGFLFFFTGCQRIETKNHQLLGYSVEYQEKVIEGIIFYEKNGKNYRYCVTVSGRSNNAAYDSYYKVLTDDESITFDSIDRRFFGSTYSPFENYCVVEFGLLP